MSNNWNVVPFTEAVDICDTFRKPINSSERASRIKGKEQSELYPYYGATGQVGFIDDYITDGEYVLLGEDGAPFLDAFSNKAYIISGKTWVNNHAHVLRSKTNNKFLCYYLNSFNYKGYVSGTTRLKLTQAEMKRIPVPVPPLSEQERIVSRIEELFSQLDAGVETLKKTKAQLAVYRQAVLKEAFEGRLTQAFREENGLPDWKTISITQAIVQRKNALKAGPFGSALKKECYVPSGYKVYGQEQVIANNENIGNYYIDEEKYQELISCAIAPHDILISLVGTVGKVLVLSDNCLPGIINPRLIKVTLDEKIMMPYFFKYYFESAYLKSLYEKKAHGATMDVLNMGMIKELPFPLCDIQEQGQVIKEIESRLSVCDSIEHTVGLALQQAEAMRQSILKKAFEGTL